VKRLGLFIGAVAALLAGAACGSDVAPAAVVNGDRIEQQDVIDELEAIRDNRAYLEGLEQSGEQVLGSAEGAFTTPYAAEVLRDQIAFQLVHQAIDERDLDVADECLDAARDDLYARLGQVVGSDAARGEVVFEDFPAEYRDTLLRRNAEFLVLQADLADQPCASDRSVEQYYEANREQFRRACLSVITLASEDDAADTLDDLEGGADFATVAREQSLDASAPDGGDIGCVPRQALESSAPELAASVFSTDEGGIGGPVESGLGWHVFRVNSFDDPTLDEVRNDVAAALADDVNLASRDWFLAVVADAEVDVDPRYGRWNPETGAIEPADAPAGDDTTEP
jgi:hypothetical protein